MFPVYLKSALRKGVFKTYFRHEYNDSNVKGIIDIPRHISKNIPFVGNIAYSQREHTTDNYITELIRHTIEFIKRKSYGNLILAKAKDELDSEAGSYTIKKYSSEKCVDEDGVWHHTRVVLSPLNMEFQPIVIDAEGTEEGDFKIYAELVQVIQKQ